MLDKTPLVPAAALTVGTMDGDDIFLDRKEDKESDDNYLIVASKTGIDGLDQKVYLRNNWSNICTMFARILILCGIHGLPDGSITSTGPYRSCAAL